MQDDILGWIDQDRERIVAFLQDLVRARSPNPPGDTRSAMEVVRGLLDTEGAAYDIYARDQTMPNLVAAQSFSTGDKHLAGC